MVDRLVGSVMLAIGLSACTTHHPPKEDRLKPLPGLVLWAWERPEDLDLVDASVGVAFLAQTLSIRDGRLAVAPRRQVLRVNPNAILVATTRIEMPSSDRTPLTDALASDVAFAIAQTAQARQVTGVQIDFDAARSQRSFYKTVIRELRHALPADVPISITALASWCVGDRWLDELPVDEIVPAIFRMGPTNERFRDIGRSGDWPAAECRAAIGTSLDEPVTLTSASRRVYVFSPASWANDSIAAARGLVH